MIKKSIYAESTSKENKLSSKNYESIVSAHAAGKGVCCSCTTSGRLEVNLMAAISYLTSPDKGKII